MTVDWVTVAAQIVNFLILAWLLKRFLYQPVIDAMARREQRIADRLNDAAASRTEADAEGEQYRRERETLERRREEILAEAEQEADGLRKQMLETARTEARAARESWLRQAAQEQTEFLTNLRRESASVVEAAARKALADLAGVKLESAMAEHFIERLETLGGSDRQALASSEGAVTVTSAFELTPAVRERISTRVGKLLGAEETEVAYRRSAELICGIELTRDGRRISWNLGDYLDRLAERVEASFQPATAADTAAGPPQHHSPSEGQARRESDR